jgi:transcriptional regulator with XRE-family HTH domain
MSGEELRQLRLALGMSQRALARALEVAPNSVARWERGEREITAPGAIRLALARLKERGKR